MIFYPPVARSVCREFAAIDDDCLDLTVVRSN